MVKIKDIAKEANVSIASVSRYFNGNIPLRESTREKIENVIRHMDYTPNRLAVALRTNKSHNIALIIPGLSNLYYVDLCEAIQSAITKIGYSVSLYITNGDKELLSKYLKELPSRLYEGVIICHLDDDPHILSLFEETQKTIPLVLLTATRERQQFNNVVIDVFNGVKDATLFLAKNGKKRIAFAVGPENTANREKLNGYLSGLGEMNIEINDELISRGTSNNYFCGYQAMERFVKLKQLPDGIVCATDDIAIGCLKKCYSNGIKVPDEMELIGFNNIKLLDTYRPSISSISQPVPAVVEDLVRLLTDSISSGGKNKTSRLFHCDLIKRESTGSFEK